MNIEENYDKIYKYVYYKVHNRELAEDLTQETFLRFLESPYIEQGKNIHYLYTIARNLCIDEMRKADRNHALQSKDIEEFLPELPSNEAPVEERVVEEVWLKEILGTLSAEDRELLFLRFVNEESLAILSQMYGISRFALYRRIAKLQKQLKQQFAAERRGGGDSLRRQPING